MNNEQVLGWMRTWGVSEVPFSGTVWMETEEGKKLTQQLERAASFSAVCLVTGANGVGKSAAVGKWVRELDRRIFQPVAMTQSSLSGSGVLAQLTHQLGQSPSFRREGNLQRLEKAMDQMERKKLVIVMDEAQHYSYGALEETRMLLGLNLPEHPRFGLILVGDEHLTETLRLRNHAALYSRISGWVKLGLWTGEQSRAWIEKAWKEVGLMPNRLSSGAMDLLIRGGRGVPRLLKQLARTAWLTAAEAGGMKLEVEHVNEALEHVPMAMELEAGMEREREGGVR